MEQPKSGYLSTEFIVALVGSLLMVGVTAGFWSAEDVQSFVAALTETAQAIAVLVATAAPIAGVVVVWWKYIAGRVDLKKKFAELTK